MARTGLDFDTVAAAAKRVSERGERVTLRSVRAEIGEGSLTTIQRHLADWQGSKERKQAAKVDAGLELPVSIVNAIMAEIKAAQDAVAEELRDQLAEALANVDYLVAENEKIREEMKELKRENVRLEEIGKISRNQMIQAGKERMEIAEKLEKQKEQNFIEKSRAEACTARLEGAARELDALKVSSKEARDEAKQAREEAAELRGMLASYKQIDATAENKKQSTRSKTNETTK